MDKLISKTEAIELFKVSKWLFDDLIKKHNLYKIKKNKCTYFERDTIINMASELEYRRQNRITNWKNGQT